MWPTVRSWFDVDSALILVVSTLGFLLAVSPNAAARVVHSRHRRAVPKPPATAIAEPAAANALKQESEALAGLQASQSALAKETADFNTAIQRRMSQLSAKVGDSQRETQQMLKQTNQRIDSTQRWFKAIVALFVFSLGGLFYAIFQLLRLQNNPVKWKGKVPDVPPGEERIVRWEPNEPANGPAGKLDVSKETSMPRTRYQEPL
jgi:hypothetical protein